MTGEEGGREDWGGKDRGVEVKQGKEGRREGRKVGGEKGTQKASPNAMKNPRQKRSGGAAL